MRSQRSFYGMDMTVKPGDRFDPERMEDFKSTLVTTELRDGEFGYVVAIVARGIVRKAHQGQENISGIISKARVLIAIAKE